MEPSPVVDQALIDALTAIGDRLDFFTAFSVVVFVLVLGLVGFIAVSRLHA